MRNDLPLEMLINAIPGKRLVIGKDYEDNYYVEYEDSDIKDGDELCGDPGRGHTVESAAKDYAKKISGKTLVFNAETSYREEIKIAFMQPTIKLFV